MGYLTSSRGSMFVMIELVKPQSSCKSLGSCFCQPMHIWKNIEPIESLELATLTLNTGRCGAKTLMLSVRNHPAEDKMDLSRLVHNFMRFNPMPHEHTEDLVLGGKPTTRVLPQREPSYEILFVPDTPERQDEDDISDSFSMLKTSQCAGTGVFWNEDNNPWGSHLGRLWI
ncbi:hypothetical protein PROFUN_14217 [Planoprotostelium fungivorum]|uniref:Uncharacterized protein n=1 Tax=Planoprotostelium fungivorum TaxID=1890364 RepID=A0A2P6N0N0_9EUKA|nr:hypothetical protein PROFUN_14217 [Planoprotostelium fungivorum]